MGATELLAEYAAGAVVGDAAREAGKLALLDTLAAALAAIDSADYTTLVTVQADGGGSGATHWGTGAPDSPASAALVNGMVAHLVEYDDVALHAKTHPSTVLWPAVAAVAEARGLSGARALDAYAVGAAVSRALHVRLPREVHYNRGWHSTGTVGVLAAVCALGHLLEIDTAGVRSALGIAGSMMAGAQANFGTPTKPLHAGLAAHNAVLAASLAAGGFGASPTLLEDDRGAFELFGGWAGDRGDDELSAEIDRWHDDWPTDQTVKLYPSCFAVHRTIAAGTRLHDDEQVRLADVRAVSVQVHRQGLLDVMRRYPDDIGEARFSLPFSIAAALIDGHVGPVTFRDDVVARADIQKLAATVVVEEAEVPASGPSEWHQGFSVVTITHQDGRQVQTRVDRLAGQHPLSWEAIEEKFVACAAAAPCDVATDDLLAAVRGMDGATAFHLPWRAT